MGLVVYIIKIIAMGQGGVKAKSMLRQLGIQPLPVHFQQGSNSTFGESATSSKVKGHSIVFNPSQVHQYIAHLAFRQQYPIELLQVRYVDIIKQHFDYCKLMVYIEASVLTLEDVIKLPFQNMCSVLYKAIRGFKLLHKQYGYFTVEPSMIQITTNGQIKVWHSKQGTNSMPKPSYAYRKVTQSQQSMINELKDVFRCKADRKTKHQQFQITSKTFEELKIELVDKLGQSFLNVQLEPQLISSCSESNENNAIVIKRSAAKSGVPQVRFNYLVNPERMSAHSVSRTERSVPKTPDLAARRNRSVTNIKITYQNKPNKDERKKDADLFSPISKLLDEELQPEEGRQKVEEKADKTFAEYQKPSVNFTYA